MKPCKSTVAVLLLMACLGGGCVSLPAQQSTARMQQEFTRPPESARPRVWWHWMNGNITQQGIQLDLEWMHRVGLGGFTVFEGSIDTPQVVQKRLIYMTPDWKRAFRYAATTAHTLGLEMTIASSPGWSETGGPWVPPAQGMKKMVWSETRVEGGKAFTGVLPQPPSTSGGFQNYSARREGEAGNKGKAPLPTFYADSAVVAYRLPSDDESQAELKPRITSSSGMADVPGLSDGDVNKVALNLAGVPAGKPEWVQFEYPQPQVIQAVTLATLDGMTSIFDLDDPKALHPYLEAADESGSFRRIADLPSSSVPQRTISFPAVTAKVFRVCFPSGAVTDEGAHPDHTIMELVLSSAARVNQFEKRAGFATAMDYDAISTPSATPGSSVPSSDVIDLTGRMQPDGTLRWMAPAGRWAILRIGYSLTGHENGPAPAEATGLEVDKLNRSYVKNYVDGYLKTYQDTVGPELMGDVGIHAMLSDSAETGSQNWTDDMLAEFKQRRGYDAHAWLPALTGVIVQSPEATNRFLWDFRRTIAELFAQNHYGEIAQELHSRHMQYDSEALEYQRPSLGDDMEMRRSADVPMGAMWTFTDSPKPTYVADLRGAASVAHIYGQNIVGAESMTSNGPAWGWSPATLKPIADLEFALGVNRFMIHESAHQPLVNKPPGMTLGPYGLWFNRNDTWAEQAGPWVTYLARSSYLLQQGHFYADVAYFYGQEGPLTALFGRQPQTDAPDGYGYDFVNADVLLNHLTLQFGRLTTPGGTSYRMLYLGGTSRHMTLPVLRRVRDLVQAGAIVAGDKPLDSPSLTDDQAAFHSIVDELWGKSAESPRAMRTFGRGRVYSGYTANEVLADLKVERDFAYTHPEVDTEVMFVHRKVRDSDIYFVDNRKDRAETIDATFRVNGKAPELWHADSGAVEPASYRIANGHTTIPIQLAANEAVFVVFAKPTVHSVRVVPAVTFTSLATLDGGWTAKFQPNRGVSKDVSFDKLASWSENTDAGVKYFSGTATYTRTLDVQPGWFKPGRDYYLDLGDVQAIAAVSLNGKSLGTVWEAPYRVALGKALRPGANTLTIQVTNLWVNRLIGDLQPGILKKYTFSSFNPYKPDSPLLPSGLLGPVLVQCSDRAPKER